ncbi:MAG: galactokinase [Bacteroidetes bacterium]|nr:MAG: galactokinase [Bacteroidota bacterium]
MIETIKKRHIESYQKEPLMLKAPSRINIIGEHTDYNLGYSLPAAVKQSLVFALSESEDGDMHLDAVDLNETANFGIRENEYPQGHWTGYFKTMLMELESRGYAVKGINCTFGGDIPIGAGMSSSSALNCGLLFGLNELFDLGLTRREMMFIAQAAEHRFGVKGGLLDQYSILNGKSGHALLLDFKNISHTYVPLEIGEYHFVLFNTCVKHSLVNSPFNQRRNACHRVMDLLAKDDEKIQSFQDFDEATLNRYKDQVDEDDYIKALFVLREDERVLKTVEALKAGDVTALGEYLWQSHAGLRNDYEVSCEELDFLVDHIRDLEGVLGSRMIGGGFGGCTINVIHEDQVQTVWQSLQKAYFDKFGVEAQMVEVEVGEGISLIG